LGVDFVLAPADDPTREGGWRPPPSQRAGRKTDEKPSGSRRSRPGDADRELAAKPPVLDSHEHIACHRRRVPRLRRGCDPSLAGHAFDRWGYGCLEDSRGCQKPAWKPSVFRGMIGPVLSDPGNWGRRCGVVPRPCDCQEMRTVATVCRTKRQLNSSSQVKTIRL
jgi:hypothetical protein